MTVLETFLPRRRRQLIETAPSPFDVGEPFFVLSRALIFVKAIGPDEYDPMSVYMAVREAAYRDRDVMDRAAHVLRTALIAEGIEEPPSKMTSDWESATRLLGIGSRYALLYATGVIADEPVNSA